MASLSLRSDVSRNSWLDPSPSWSTKRGQHQQIQVELPLTSVSEIDVATLTSPVDCELELEVTRHCWRRGVIDSNARDVMCGRAVMHKAQRRRHEQRQKPRTQSSRSRKEQISENRNKMTIICSRSGSRRTHLLTFLFKVANGRYAEVPRPTRGWDWHRSFARRSSTMSWCDLSFFPTGKSDPNSIGSALRSTRPRSSHRRTNLRYPFWFFDNFTSQYGTTPWLRTTSCSKAGHRLSSCEPSRRKRPSASINSAASLLSDMSEGIQAGAERTRHGHVVIMQDIWKMPVHGALAQAPIDCGGGLLTPTTNLTTKPVPLSRGTS